MHGCKELKDSQFPFNIDMIWTKQTVNWNAQIAKYIQKPRQNINKQENINSVCIVLRKWSNKKSSEFVGASLYSAAMLQAMNLRNRLEDCIALERLKRWYCPENYDIAHQPWQSAVKLTGQLCLSQPFRQTLKRVIWECNVPMAEVREEWIQD